MARVYFSIGSNMGNCVENLKKALSLMKEGGIDIQKISPVYITAPIGYENQDDFYNIAVKAETTLMPFKLLKLCKSIETELFRIKLIENGPRTIDIDILTYDTWKIGSEALTIPHPRITERAFVLYPLYDVAEDAMKKAIEPLLEKVSGQRIEKLEGEAMN